VLDLDRHVNDYLTGWRVPDNDFTRDHPMTLRQLLSMTAGVGVPGYLGYEPGQKRPTLQQILDGTPPANSPPVRVEAIPGSRYAYSGGGFEIVQALIEAKTKMKFEDALQDLLLRPAGMANSYFLQPLPGELVRRAATGHDANGNELPGGWRVVPNSRPADCGPRRWTLRVYRLSLSAPIGANAARCSPERPPGP
jgi:CubicO group peptidase (beta-lactamase class C family)